MSLRYYLLLSFVQSFMYSHLCHLILCHQYMMVCLYSGLGRLRLKPIIVRVISPNALGVSTVLIDKRIRRKAVSAFFFNPAPIFIRLNLPYLYSFREFDSISIILGSWPVGLI
jgi:hypothetical protein